MNHGPRKTRPFHWLSIVLLLFGPATARAHAPIEGLGDFVNGIVHPLVTPSHLLILIGLGLLTGQHTPLKLKTPALVFGVLSAIALLLTTTAMIKTVYAPVLIAIGLIAGILVALEKKLPPPAAWAFFAVAAIAIGLDSGVESDSKATVAKSLVGTWLSLLVIMCDVAIYAAFATKKEWSKVGLRVLGAWIVAVAVLVLAFSLRK